MMAGRGKRRGFDGEGPERRREGGRVGREGGGEQ